MLMAWAQEEMRDADLQDKRLADRLVALLSDLGERPTASIPAACGGYNETTAAYRFFDNERVVAKPILAPHAAQTCVRLAAQAVVLMVQDTSEIDVTRPQQQVAGAGPLGGSGRRGLFLHPLIAFTPDGTPLGCVWSHMWARTDDALTAKEKKRRRQAAPIEEKESYRWLEGLRQARAVAQSLPTTTCICVADSEADIYELLAEPRGAQPVHWLIRACHLDRGVVVAESAAESATATRQLREEVLAAPVRFTKEIQVRGRPAKIGCDQRARRQPRQNRATQVEVRATTLTLRPPQRADRELPAVTVNVVLVREIDPPSDDIPVEWLLLTTLPIETVDQVREVVQYYTVRFLIEEYFKVLKSGCRVEARRFESLDRLQPCLAVYMIVAWRTMMLCRMGRGNPNMSCEALFEPAEWKAVWLVVQRDPLPAVPPSLQEIILLVAQLGGYVLRPGRKDPPGVQTTWLGLQRLRDLAWAYEVFGPDAKPAAPNNLGDV